MRSTPLQRIKNIIGSLEIIIGTVCLMISLYGKSLKYWYPDSRSLIGQDALLAIYGLLVAGNLIAAGLLLKKDGANSWLGQLLPIYAIFIFSYPE